MKYCTKCGREMADEAAFCSGCGNAMNAEAAPSACATTTTTTTVNTEDKVNIGLCVLSFFIPLFGIIYWPLKHKEAPKEAKACGITAIVSWGARILLSILLYVVYFVLMLGVYGNLYDMF